MNTQLTIKVDDRHVLDSPDGQHLYLRVIDGGEMGYGRLKADADEHRVHSLQFSDASLTYHGIGPKRYPDFKPAKAALKQNLSVITDLVEADPTIARMATFGGGHFKVRWTPDTYDAWGYWSLAQPSDPRRHIHIQRYGVTRTHRQPTDGVWDALERTLFTSDVKMRYENADRAMHRLVELLTGDAYLVRTGAE